MKSHRGFRDLEVYQLAYSVALQVFRESKAFPPEEKYELTRQIRNSSRSVASNIAEAYRKRRYAKVFVNKLSDADGEASETGVWLDFARDCGYMSREKHDELLGSCERLGRMLGGMLAQPEKFTH